MAYATITLQIKLDDATLVVEPLPTVWIDRPYSAQLRATDGTGTYKFRLHPDTPLPPGLTLSEDGLISGTVPSTAIASDVAWDVQIEAMSIEVTL